MRLTKQTDYSLRVLIYLGVREGQAATIDEVADAYAISRNHLMKVVYNLANHGIIDTQRGRGGGFRLAHSPEQINLGAVIRVTEPDFALVECFDPLEKSCPISTACRLRGILREAMEEWLKVVERYTLADLLEPGTPLPHLLGIETLTASADY